MVWIVIFILHRNLECLEFNINGLSVLPQLFLDIQHITAETISQFKIETFNFQTQINDKILSDENLESRLENSEKVIQKDSLVPGTCQNSSDLRLRYVLKCDFCFMIYASKPK